jgi:hypothetical protein
LLTRPTYILVIFADCASVSLDASTMPALSATTKLSDNFSLEDKLISFLTVSEKISSNGDAKNALHSKSARY